MKEKKEIDTIVCPYCKTETPIEETTCIKCKNRIPLSLRSKTQEEIKSAEKDNHKFNFNKKQEEQKKENSIDKLLANNSKKEEVIKDSTPEIKEEPKKADDSTKKEPSESTYLSNEEASTEKKDIKEEPKAKKESLKDTIEIPYAPDYFTKERIVSIVEEHNESSSYENEEEIESPEKSPFDLENVMPELDIDEKTELLEEVNDSEDELDDNSQEEPYKFEYIDDIDDNEEETTDDDEIEDDYMHLDEENTLANYKDDYIEYEDLDKTVVIPNLEEDIRNEKFTDLENFNIPKYFIRSFVNPYDKYQKEEENLSKFKTSVLITVIVIITMTILRLLNSMINAVRITSFWTGETSWVWKNLSDVQYLHIIGEELLIFTSLLIGISAIYFILNIILKKKQQFTKILSLVVTSFIPFGVAYGLLAPILSLIYIPLGITVTIIGFIYSLVTLIELLNQLLNIENVSSRILFHMLCLSVIFVTIGLIIYQMLISTLGV